MKVREGYLDIGELCENLGVSESTIRRYIKKGMPCYRLGERKFIFSLQECLDWLIKKN